MIVRALENGAIADPRQRISAAFDRLPYLVRMFALKRTKR
jgi:hypothetical protein